MVSPVIFSKSHKPTASDHQSFIKCLVHTQQVWYGTSCFPKTMACSNVRCPHADFPPTPIMTTDWQKAQNVFPELKQVSWTSLTWTHMHGCQQL